MNYLIIGGSKSGKSHISEQIALSLNKDKAVYIATMKPFDIEDEERIKNHIKAREGLNFITIEKQLSLHEIVNEIKENDTVLLDSITSLLTNEMFAGNEIVTDLSIKILTSLDLIMNKAENTIIVSDFIFNDSMEYDDITEIYKKELGIINRHLARICENVIECSFGNIKYHKGGN